MTSLTVLDRQCGRESRGQNTERGREEKPDANTQSFQKEESRCGSGNLVRSSLPLKEDESSGGEM